MDRYIELIYIFFYQTRTRLIYFFSFSFILFIKRIKILQGKKFHYFESDKSMCHRNACVTKKTVLCLLMKLSINLTYYWWSFILYRGHDRIYWMLISARGKWDGWTTLCLSLNDLWVFCITIKSGLNKMKGVKSNIGTNKKVFFSVVILHIITFHCSGVGTFIYLIFLLLSKKEKMVGTRFTFLKGKWQWWRWLNIVLEVVP